MRVPSVATGSTLTCIETINAPGFGPSLHRHRATEMFLVLEGRYLFDADGRQLTASEGDLVSVPGGCAHTFVKTTDAPARQFIQILPGMDAAAFFLALAEVMRDGRPDRARLNTFGEPWHVEFLGPPLASR